MTQQATTSSSSGGGIGFTGALTITFIVLKLTNVIGWSWVWVLSPLWITAGLVLVLFLLFSLGFLIYHVRQDQKRKKGRTRRW